ncbi:hypothetical protein [Clostridium tagluense]|uniref:Uncharacterized protein n=1 Tax=Clostridium tagluense TaxID=360422 RepID=A0A401UNR7_9CLOT|nr:hypothetical protein [Clostridium tagluense]GCD11184.1 hypothetical protein Ctaglu_28070 [Clostridium tagluense]
MNFSAVEEFKKASKLAKLRYYVDISKGKSGHISSLDSILKKVRHSSRNSLRNKKCSIKKDIRNLLLYKK